MEEQKFVKGEKVTININFATRTTAKVITIDLIGATTTFVEKPRL